MNTKLKIALIRRYSDQGFALPIAMAMGFIMVLIAGTLVMRSHGDQVTASAQKATAQSLAVAEGGVTRTLAKLNQSDPDISSLLKRNYDPINPDTGKNYLGSDGIPNTNDETTTAVNQWTSSNMPPCISTTDLLSGNIGNSTYEVLAYRYDATNKTGTLLVKGQVGATSSQSRVQQTFNVKPRESSFIAVLGTDDIALDNNDVRGIYGNVACTNATKCPVTCPYTTASARTAIGADNNGFVDGKIYIGSIPTPALPLMPTVWNGTGSVPTTPFTISLTSPISGNNTFPRSSDVSNHIAGTPYHYQIPSISLSGSSTVTIITQTHATYNPTGDPVYFWVSGNIDIGGSSTLIHSAISTNPTAFRIYGTSTSGQDILVGSGAAGMDAFIFAPNARVGINGTGIINGLVYAKSYGEIGSNGNAVVNVPNNPNLASSLGDLAVYFSSKTDSTNSWQRQAN